MTRFFVYHHVRPDTNQVFYVGKGSVKRRDTFERAYSVDDRNIHWLRIVSKCDGEFYSSIVGLFDNETEAFDVERALISHYGRATDGGQLCNMTEGGEGHIGLTPSAATRARLSRAFSGTNHPNWGKKLSAETCRKKSESMRSSPYNLRGKKLPDWWRAKIAATKMGSLNPMWGRKGLRHPRSRSVVSAVTGKHYPSITSASRSIGVSFQHMHAMLTGARTNYTSLRLS